METRGSPMPLYVNPAEFLLDLTSSDFADDVDQAKLTLQKLHQDWKNSAGAEALTAAVAGASPEKSGLAATVESKSRTSFPVVVAALLHRSWIKSYRDVVAYGIRFAMYIGLAIMMETVWLRLPTTQSSIGPFTNAIVSVLSFHSPRGIG